MLYKSIINVNTMKVDFILKTNKNILMQNVKFNHDCFNNLNNRISSDIIYYDN